MKVKTFHHKNTGTLTHLLIDDLNNYCVLIDSVLDYEEGQIKTDFLEVVLMYISQHNLKLDCVLDTHLHADHLTASFYLRQNLNVQTGISHNYLASIKKNNIMSSPGYSFYVSDGDIIKSGNMVIKVLETPGHTNTCVSYIVDENIFCGDLMFVPTIGSGRCDIGDGDSEKLFFSGNKLLSYPDYYKIYSGHDYPNDGERYKSFSTVKEQVEKNIYFQIKKKNIFIKKRALKDSSLTLPKLFKESLMYNTLGKLT